MKQFDIRAGERQRIVHMISDSIPQQVRFTAASADGGAISGRVEVQGSRWLFRKPVATYPLQAHNVVAKGMFDTLFSVAVVPDADVRVTLESRHFSARALVFVLVGVVVIAAAAAFAFSG